MEIKELLKELSGAAGVSGYESDAANVVERLIRPYVDEVSIDKLGSVIALKRGEGTDKERVLLAAHLDEIGLMVTKIEDGFIRFTNVGGVDVSILPGQTVKIFGEKLLQGIIGSKPPHLQHPGESSKPVQMDDLFIDTGMGDEEVKKYVGVGSIIRLDGEFTELSNGCVSGQAMDDRAGIAVMIETLRRLTERRHKCDVYAIATSQEEVSGLGAISSAFRIEPHVAIAIDVTFGDSPGIPERKVYQLGKGPTIGLGPNFHPKITQRLKDLASEFEIPIQIEADPHPGGTDAFSIQVSRSGVPTGLVSIPLRNMHTTVETLKLDDIKRAAELLSIFIMRLDSKFLEELKCL